MSTITILASRLKERVLERQRMVPPSDVAALEALVGELGVARGVWMAVRVTVEGGRVFSGLGPPRDESERLSRAQIGPAVVMYKALRSRLGAAEAMRITREVVNASGVVFMKGNIGSIRQSELKSLSEEGRRAFMEARSEKFFNALIEWQEVRSDRVGFHVHACLFPGLCAAVGVPELASVFCGVDAAFFGGVESNVSLKRDKTIAGGDDHCAFELTWTPAAPEEEG